MCASQVQCQTRQMSGHTMTRSGLCSVCFFWDQPCAAASPGVFPVPPAGPRRAHQHQVRRPGPGRPSNTNGGAVRAKWGNRSRGRGGEGSRGPGRTRDMCVGRRGRGRSRRVDVTPPGRSGWGRRGAERTSTTGGGPALGNQVGAALAGCGWRVGKRPGRGGRWDGVAKDPMGGVQLSNVWLPRWPRRAAALSTSTTDSDNRAHFWRRLQSEVSTFRFRKLLEAQVPWNLCAKVAFFGVRGKGPVGLFGRAFMRGGGGRPSTKYVCGD